ncbi:ABC transporter permease [Paenibacillus roseipurpureus]|uniref:ABC transporter permease subunit n=1 Tax=Paenibacillus roseopurpureus TaxID=2918901 RepID=A0AA96LKV6_9BACL|nr:ABC transporter permease subunit [Paenibacillus sp. MBLB1832]WNR42908.1 ABC transporter permease subunit [Paenibacillus sp. MBLB1832]
MKALVEETVLPSTRPKVRSDFWRYVNRYKFYYLMLLPGIVLIAIFRIAPFYGITVAFKDYNIFKGINGSPWVGLDWFKVLFHHPDFFRILKNSLTINLLELIFVFPAPIVLALLLNELRMEWFKRVTQSIVYIPHFFSWVIVGGFIIRLLSPSTGPIRIVFEWLGVEPFMLLLQQSWFYPILVSGEIWKSAGWGTILYMAAITGIEQEQYEAAIMDGASRLRRMLHITLPGMAFVIVLNLVLQMGHMLDVGFEKIFILSNPSVQQISEVFSTYNYNVGIVQQRYSFSVALGLFQSVIGFGLVILANRIAKWLRNEAVF